MHTWLFRSCTFLSLLSLGGCRNSDPAPQQQQPVAQAGTLSARIDNAPVLFGQVNITASGSLLLQAYRGGNDLLLLQFPAVGSPSSFSLGTSRQVFVGLSQYGATPRDYFSYNCSAAGGTITITEVDQANQTVSGTFTARVCSADGQTFLNVTNGSFTKIRIQ